MKKIIFMLMMMLSVITMNAQTAMQTTKVFDNAYVGIDGGVATPLSFSNVFPVNPVVGLHFGKLFTPVVGAEIEGSTWFGSHTHYLTNGVSRFDGYTNPSHNAFRGLYLGANALFNLTNLFNGYEGTPRNFEVSAVSGIGWIHDFTPNNRDKYTGNHLGAKTGLDFAFNLGKEKEHTISFRPAVLWNLSQPGNANGNLAFNKHGAQFYVGVGYTYHFKTSNKTRHFKIWDVGALQNEVDRLNAELAKKPNEIVKEVVKEVVVPKVVNGNEYVVYFSQNSDVLTDEAKVVLDNIKGNVVIDGYASPEGTEKYNKELSQRRANVVAEYLKTKGVVVGNAVGRGVVGETSNRVAVIIVQ